MSLYTDRDDQCKCVSDIDSPAVHSMMSEELKKNNINEAWLPLKKVKFYEWRWLSGDVYGTYLR